MASLGVTDSLRAERRRQRSRTYLSMRRGGRGADSVGIEKPDISTPAPADDPAATVDSKSTTTTTTITTAVASAAVHFSSVALPGSLGASATDENPNRIVSDRHTSEPHAPASLVPLPDMKAVLEAFLRHNSVLLSPRMAYDTIGLCRRETSSVQYRTSTDPPAFPRKPCSRPYENNQDYMRIVERIDQDLRRRKRRQQSVVSQPKSQMTNEGGVVKSDEKPGGQMDDAMIEKSLQPTADANNQSTGMVIDEKKISEQTCNDVALVERVFQSWFDPVENSVLAGRKARRKGAKGKKALAVSSSADDRGTSPIASSQQERSGKMGENKSFGVPTEESAMADSAIDKKPETNDKTNEENTQTISGGENGGLSTKAKTREQRVGTAKTESFVSDGQPIVDWKGDTPISQSHPHTASNIVSKRGSDDGDYEANRRDADNANITKSEKKGKTGPAIDDDDDHIPISRLGRMRPDAENIIDVSEVRRGKDDNENDKVPLSHVERAGALKSPQTKSGIKKKASRVSSSKRSRLGDLREEPTPLSGRSKSCDGLEKSQKDPQRSASGGVGSGSESGIGRKVYEKKKRRSQRQDSKPSTRQDPHEQQPIRSPESLDGKENLSGPQSISSTAPLAEKESNLCSAFLYLMMRQLRPCLVFSRKDCHSLGNHDLALACACCRTKCFPVSTAEDLDQATQGGEIFLQHLLQCVACPMTTKKGLIVLKATHRVQTEALDAKTRHIFLQTIWGRMKLLQKVSDPGGIEMKLEESRKAGVTKVVGKRRRNRVVCGDDDSDYEAETSTDDDDGDR